MKKGDPVKVWWIDSSVHKGWGNLQPHEINNLNCETVGLFFEKNKISLIVAQNWADNKNNTDYVDGVYGDYMEIPLVAIKKIRKLKE